MRLLFLLLFCAQSLVSIFASNPHSDIWSRGAKMSRYIVTPVDPTNITATESKLKTMFGEEKFLKSKRQDEITFSFFTNLSKNVTAAVARELDSKQPVESQDIAPRADAVPTNFDRYTALPKENADDEKTGEFLKSKIQPGTLMVAVEDQDGRVMAWYNVALSQEAKEEVEKYEGTEKLIPLPSTTSDSASAANDRQQSEAKRSEIVARDITYYTAMATNDSDTKSTEEFLKSKVQNGIPIFQHRWDGVVSGWFNLALDDNAKKEVEGHEGIKRVKVMVELEFFRAVPPVQHLPLPNRMYDGSQEKTTLNRRAGNWEKQQFSKYSADKALIMDSQYSGSDLAKLTAFVHVTDPGKDTFIYVMDRGVKLDLANTAGAEFRPPGDLPERMTVFQSEKSRSNKEDPYEDDHKDKNGEKTGHGTAVASKALGSRYGLAKKATLISVKIDGIDDWEEAIEFIKSDINVNPGRERRSVVISTSGSRTTTSYEEAKNDEEFQRWLGRPIKSLLQMGVPFVCASGNHGTEPNRHNMDTVPGVLQDADTPIIVVGSAEYDGSRSDFSQDGSQVTIYAPGREVEVQSLTDFQSTIKSGTSYAAPQVAGLIATYLAYDVKPWDDSKQGIERVKAIRDYLTSDRSSWERKSGIRMIWNGAGEKEHQSAGADGVGTEPPKPSAPPTPPSPPPAQPSKALAVILQRELISDYQYVTSPIYKNRWLFYETDRGVAPGCRDEKDALANAEVGRDSKMIFNAPWPSITQPVKVDNMECEYKNNGQNPGALWCKGRKDAITCYEDQAKKDKDPTYCRNGPGEIARRPTAYCEW